MPFQIKDFKKMFPEIYPLVSSAQSVVFATYKEVSRNLLEKNSPVTLGVAVKKEPTAERKSYFTLLAFNVQDEGRLVKDPKYIDGNTYIREFTIERTIRMVVFENLNGDWKEIKNFFRQFFVRIFFAIVAVGIKKFRNCRNPNMQFFCYFR